MKPRIGAIFGRALLCFAVCACLLPGARVAFADDAGEVTAPGPRPQSIPIMLLPDPADEPADALTDAPAPSVAKQETPVAAPVVEDVDSQRALGVPNGSAVESQHIPLTADDGTNSGMLGSLDPRTNEAVRVIGALAIVIGLILLLRAAVRRMGGPLVEGGKPSGVLLVLARYPVGRGQSMVMLKLGRRLLLCHQTKGSMTTLCEIEGEDEVAAMLARIEAGSRGKEAGRFEKLLAEFNHEYRRRAIPSRSEGPDMQRAMSNAPVIDLTRRQSGPASWLRLRKAAS